MADPKDNTISADQYTTNKGPFDYFDQSVSFGGTGMKEGLDTGIGVTSALTVDSIKAGTESDLMPGLESQNLFKSTNFTNLSNMSHKGFAKSKSKYKDFNDMMKQHGNLSDRSGSNSLSQVGGPLLAGAAGLALSASGVGTKRVGEGPSGKGMSMGVPILSDAVMKTHWDNYALTEAKFMEADNAFQKSFPDELTYGNFSPDNFDSNDVLTATKNFHKSNSTGFYANFGNLNISRNPDKGRYDGPLHLFGPNAHNSFKTVEALGKGLDPTGYRLDGENENNRGAVSNANGTAGITEDGYYVYSDFNSSFGYTKTVLRGKGGAGSESWEMAKHLGLGQTQEDVDIMVKAMEIARSGSKTFSQALLELTGKVPTTEGSDTTTSSTFDKTFTKIEDTVSTLSEIGSNVGQQIAQGATTVGENINKIVQNVVNNEEPNRGAGTKVTSSFSNVRDAVSGVKEGEDKVDTGSWGRYGFNTGGQVSSPVGQLASMLRANRLGYNQGGAVQSGYYGYQDGGEINMQEMGFVNGKTPDQVTDAQSVADTEATQAEEGDFVINAPAVEIVGVDNLIQLMSEALQRAEQEGARIVDIPPTTEPEQMVNIFVSEGEFIVPRELIPFVEGGIELLEQINEAGKGEVAERVEESPMQGQPMEQQQPVQEFSLASPEKRNAISAAKFQNEMQELPV